MAFGRRTTLRSRESRSRNCVDTTQAFSELYEHLLCTARRIWRVPDIEDVVQEAFLRLTVAEKRTKVLDRAAFLHVAALNIVRDRLRSEAIRHANLADLTYLEQEAARSPSAERALAARESLAAVDEAIGELPQNARAAFVMGRLDNLPHVKIAEELNISVSMVEKHIRRVLVHCRGRLAETNE